MSVFDQSFQPLQPLDIVLYVCACGKRTVEVQTLSHICQFRCVDHFRQTLQRELSLVFLLIFFLQGFENVPGVFQTHHGEIVDRRLAAPLRKETRKEDRTETFSYRTAESVKVNEIIVERPNDLKREKSLHGLTRSLLQNMVTGVSDGYKKTLEINGVGYRATKQGNKLVLALGYSHPIEMIDPEGLESKVEGNKITITGIDKQAVGQYAANIREKRGPEPYKGKGIKYSDEIIRRKVGKTGKK